MLGQYPWDPERMFGGVEAAMAYLAGELVRFPELDLHVVSCKTETATPQTRAHGAVRVTYLPRQGLGRITFHAREVRAMRRLIAEERPDLVHAHGTGLYAGAAVGCGRPAVITAHGIMFREAQLARTRGDRLRGMLDAAYERWCLTRARNLIALCPYVAREFGETFRGRTFIVPNAVAEGFFRLQRRAEPGRILFTGLVMPRKALADLVRALARVKDALPAAHLRVAGDTGSYPEYYRTVQALAGELGVADRVSFLGYLTEPEVLDEYSRAQCLALPSCQETLPVVVQQAMAAGLPVLSTRVGGVPDIIEDGRNGVLVDKGDVAGLARGLARLLTDGAMAASLAAAARAHADEHFAAGQVARRTLDVYRTILTGNGGAP